MIRGAAKGRRLHSIEGTSTRPTSDRVKEAVFNLIEGLWEPGAVLDLFAGSGGLGIEALSRGASKAVFVEHHRGTADTIARNLRHCGLEEKGEILRTDVLDGLAHLVRRGDRFGLVFMDPPYEKGWISKTFHGLARLDPFPDGSLLVVEHSVREPPDLSTMSARLIKSSRYGDTVVSILDTFMRSVIEKGGT